MNPVSWLTGVPVGGTPNLASSTVDSDIVKGGGRVAAAERGHDERERRRSQTVMSAFEFGILGLYFLTLVILAIMGFHRYVMVWLYFKHRTQKAEPAPLPAVLPRVTIQLPIFNEMYVLDRLLESVAQIRYPKDLLEIQVLDDSTDETTTIASRAGRALPRARASTSTTCTAPTAPATRRAPSTPACARPPASSSSSSTPTSSPRPTSWRRPSATSPTRRSAWCRPAGATSTATTRC